jgi:hypothetical protein
MRTEKELWELVLKYQNLYRFGLCRWVTDLHATDAITYAELEFLRGKIKSYMPQPTYSGYCWQPFNIEPRINWINERIKQIENETI